MYLPEIPRETISQFESIAPSLMEIQQTEEIEFMDEEYKRPRYQDVTINQIDTSQKNIFGRFSLAQTESDVGLLGNEEVLERAGPENEVMEKQEGGLENEEAVPEPEEKL